MRHYVRIRYLRGQADLVALVLSVECARPTDKGVHRCTPQDIPCHRAAYTDLAGLPYARQTLPRLWEYTILPSTKA
jgi:hypothetical protein